MLIKRVTIQGFKTFANRTEFIFDPGVTAVVGPNGSGKSNIVDAMRWCLGEQSFSLLRSKKTADIKSPMIGTFYRSSNPDSPPFVSVGDRVEKGQTVCIIEAMKLFNEIESEVSGTIVKAMVENSSPVEYDQVLFVVEPD